MAVKDVREFYYHTQAQYLEMKQDLAEVEQAFKDGYITEDKLANVKQTMEIIEQNYNRATYFMYLLELPNRPVKKEKWKKSNKSLGEALSARNADFDAVKAENKSALDALRAELKSLTEKK